MIARMGTVVSYSDGYGYIAPADGGGDLVFDRANCDQEPHAGSLVSFATRAKAGRPVAENIRVLR